MLIDTYDDLNRLVKETADPTHPSLALEHAPATIDHQYDAAGNRLSSSIQNSTFQILHSTTWTYDTRNRVLTKATDEGTLTYTYDAAGNLASTTSSNPNGIQNTYTYDDLNRLESVNDGRQPFALSFTSYDYDDVGNLETVDYGNTISHSYTYDTLNRLTNLSIDQMGVGQVAGYTYTLSNAGNRTQVSEASGRTLVYSYDNLYRLTSEVIAGDPLGMNGAIDYTYDLVGNRLARNSTLSEVEGQSFTYDDNDRLTTDTYDDNGNTTVSEDLTDPGTSVTDTYSFCNRLIRRTKADGSIIDLTYDANANRIGKIIRDSSSVILNSTDYLVDENNHTGFAQVVEEWVGTDGPGGPNGSLDSAYTYGHDLISQDRLQSDPLQPNSLIPILSFYLYDGHGTVRQLVDEFGSLQNEYAYDAFGILLSSTGDLRNDYLYTGEQFDADLGMYFLRARYLNTQTGRLHSMDTFDGRNGEPLTLHKYLYAHANPVMNIDPSGRLSIAQVAATGAIIGALAGMGAVSIKHGLKVASGKPFDLGEFAVDLWKETITGAATGALGAGVAFRAAQLLRYLAQGLGVSLSTFSSGAITGTVAGFSVQGFKELFAAYFDFIILKKPLEFRAGASRRVFIAAISGFSLGGFSAVVKSKFEVRPSVTTIRGRGDFVVTSWGEARVATTAGILGTAGVEVIEAQIANAMGLLYEFSRPEAEEPVK